jgi:hypothetical protein
MGRARRPRHDNGDGRGLPFESVKSRFPEPQSVVKRNIHPADRPGGDVVAGRGSGMSRRERLVAGFLLAIAVVGVALIPCLLSAPVTSLGVAIDPGPGRTVVLAPTISTAPRRAAHPQIALPEEVSAAPVAPAVAVTVKPAAKPSVVHAEPTPPPPSTPAAFQRPSPPSPRPADPTPLAAGRGPGGALALPPKPAHGPLPGQDHSPPPGVKRDPGEHGHDLRGSGHARPVPQVPPHAVGSRHRHVGRMAKAPSRPAPAAPEAGPKARSKAGRPSGKGGPAPPLIRRRGPRGRQN